MTAVRPFRAAGLVVIVAAWIAGASAAQAETDGVRPIWIDVRTPAEYESGHLPGAYNMNFDEIDRGIGALGVAPDYPIILYCQSGRRSGFARETLLRMGYTNVQNAGGIGDVLRHTGLAPAVGPGCEPREC